MGEFIKHITKSNAIQAGLRIFRINIKRSITDEFEGMTDEEIICYIMANICKWSSRRLEKVLKASHPTIRKRIEDAIEKRKTT